MRSLGLLLAAIPFGFALLRAVGTGTDFRYAWVALAAAIAAGTALAAGARNARPAAGGFFVALCASTVAASVTGFGLGAQSVPAVVFVALGFAICEAAGLTLVSRARRLTTDGG